MTVQAKDLPRSFSPSTNAGECGICREEFLTGDGLAFYATVRRDGAGEPVWSGEAQVIPGDARTPVRPQGCTCRGRSAHTVRCALYVTGCGCPTRSGRNGRYTAHQRRCRNSISFAERFATLPGFKDHAVHCACALNRGMEIPTEAKVAYGRRVEGLFSTAGVGTAQPVAGAPALTGTEALAVSQNELAAVVGQGVANAVAEANAARAALAADRLASQARIEADRSWMAAEGRFFAAEREASIRARAEAAEAAKAGREGAASRGRQEAKAERQAASSGRFAALDLSDDDGERALEAGALTSGEERFAALDLD